MKVMAARARLARAMRGLSEWALSLALPRVCVDCGGVADSARSLCSRCREDVMTENVFPPLPEGVASLCAGARLAGPVRRLVHGLKYDGHRAARLDLVDLLMARGRPVLPAGALLVPVPITRTRRRERGYNQAELLAAEIGLRLGLPVEPNFLARTTFRGSQTKKSGEQRREALAGMFAPGPGFRSDAIPVLVDDVLTTGATLSACAAASLFAGVPEVHALCMAWAGEA